MELNRLPRLDYQLPLPGSRCDSKSRISFSQIDLAQIHRLPSSFPTVSATRCVMGGVQPHSFWGKFDPSLTYTPIGGQTASSLAKREGGPGVDYLLSELRELWFGRCQRQT